MRNLVLCLSALLLAATCSASSSSNSLGTQDASTHELLSSLGLKKLMIPAAHHRKRLAEQARRHTTGDSRMFVIKLPPNTNYYAHADSIPPAARKIPLQLNSNGKPAKVYHWNLPLLKKIASQRPQARFDDDLINIENTPTWSKVMNHNSHPNSLDPLAYYVPTKKKASFRKYFSGNGKPKSFYILEKSMKVPHYHRLLP